MNLPGGTHYAFRPASFSGGEAAAGRFGTLPLLRVFCRFRGSDRDGLRRYSFAVH